MRVCRSGGCGCGWAPHWAARPPTLPRLRQRRAVFVGGRVASKRRERAGEGGVIGAGDCSWLFPPTPSPLTTFFILLHTHRSPALAAADGTTGGRRRCLALPPHQHLPIRPRQPHSRHRHSSVAPGAETAVAVAAAPPLNSPLWHCVGKVGGLDLPPQRFSPPSTPAHAVVGRGGFAAHRRRQWKGRGAKAAGCLHQVPFCSSRGWRGCTPSAPPNERTRAPFFVTYLAAPADPRERPGLAAPLPAAPHTNSQRLPHPPYPHGNPRQATSL